MKKLCKIVMLPTAKATWPNCMWLGRISGQLRVDHSYDDDGRSTDPVDDSMLPQHLYILSDNEIKEGDWYIDDCDEIRQAVTSDRDYWDRRPEYKKIIATTDSSFKIARKDSHLNSIWKLDGALLPYIPQSFIDKYVSEYNKGNKIEEVMVEYLLEEYEDDGKRYHYTDSRMTPKLNLDNTIDISTIKDSWTRDEVIELIRAYHASFASYPTMNLDLRDKWIRLHLI